MRVHSDVYWTLISSERLLNPCFGNRIKAKPRKFRSPDTEKYELCFRECFDMISFFREFYGSDSTAKEWILLIRSASFHNKTCWNREPTLNSRPNPTKLAVSWLHLMVHTPSMRRKFACDLQRLDCLISPIISIQFNDWIHFPFDLLPSSIISDVAECLSLIENFFSFRLLPSHIFKYLSTPYAFCLNETSFYHIFLSSSTFFSRHWHKKFLLFSFHRDREERKNKTQIFLPFLFFLCLYFYINR